MADRHIVIVGGGFSGTALAIHLARGGRAGLKVTVIEPREGVAQGVAYGSRDPAHRINVPADRMQLTAAEQGDFDRWFRASAAYAEDPAARWQDGRVYPQRGQFAAWIAGLFAEVQRESAVDLRHLRDRAVALENGEVVTAGGERLRADELVLAISHPPPALPRAIALALEGHPRLIADPWRHNALADIAPDESIAIIGSGLTMADTVATLHRHGHRGSIVAFSRRGLLPRSNLSGSFEPRALDYASPQPDTALGWLRRIRREVNAAAEERLPWQLVLDDVRVNGQAIWQRLSLSEQRRFLRHLRPWWDVHRYRIAPQVNAVLEQWQTSGQLAVLAARLKTVTAEGRAIRLALQPRRGAPRTLKVDRLIVTTGPAHGGLLQSDALLHQLALDGVIQPDELALGIKVNGRSQAVNRFGAPNLHLWVAGPAARGRFGELMGLPQVAEHAESVANQLLAGSNAADGSGC
ncbi:FAD/NAD(P)-binding protein [Erwinia sp. JUb26]|uniref:FAD/NAD(P)-binding protein n=1 Tax=Erwinia sp. JUb26 TaxID=2485126 RepID=UPI000F4A76EC|nr:FAD-dependent oxidoreductase [Erwinia sp. JUb26]ROR15017.1 putative NAD(P)/FAD-binding protein YdhS [Erwinia sp. JUb26]